MQNDLFGQPTSLSTAAGIEAWNATQRGFLSHAAATPERLAQVLRAEPDFALGHAARGLFCLLLGRLEMVAAARDALEAARAAQRRAGATGREAAYLEALADGLAGRPSGAVQRLEAVLRAHPDDALAMKLSQAIRFVMGDAAGMRRSAERLLPAYDAAHPARGYLMGCHAFALEETGAYQRAEIAGRQALWLAPDDAWGLHAVAHVHEMTGDAGRGIDWLEGHEAAWAHCNNFRYHVWWHLALMHLDRGRFDRVLDLYDRQIRAERTDDYRDIANAASLLMRLDLEGVPTGARWRELADLAAARTEDGCLIFADLHYLMALGGDGRRPAAARLLRRIRRDARAGATETQQAMARPGLDAARGLAAFSGGRFAAAFRHLARARDSLHLAGGSHAQRDVFERMAIDAGIRAGLLDQAEGVLDARQARWAGREDGYSTARRDLIAAGRGQPAPRRIPAQ